MEGDKTRAMDEKTIEQVVLSYLKRKGYKNAELAFKDEAKTQPVEEMVQEGQLEIDTSIANKILFYDLSNTTSSRYRDGYDKLQAWVHSSLDLYKNELLRVLYPVFVHSFLDLVARGYADQARQFFDEFRGEHERLHLHDLHKLQGVSLPQHLQESELARTFRENKINVRLCQYAHELLMQFLLGANLMGVLSALNEHINFQVHAGQPSAVAEEEQAVTLTGQPVKVVDQLNLKDIKWGALEDGAEHKFEKEMLAAPAEDGEAKGGAKDGDPLDAKKRAAGAAAGPGAAAAPAGGGGAAAESAAAAAAAAAKGPGPNKKAKKEKGPTGGPGGGGGGGASGKGGRADLFGIPAVRVKSNIPLPTMSEDAERQVLEDLRRRVRVSAQALPSVCFYTFLHAHSNLNCVALSPDGALVAGGFSDSSIKIWDMAKAGTAQLSSPPPPRRESQDGAAHAPHANGDVPRGSHSTPGRGRKTDAGAGTGGGERGQSYTELQGHAGPVFSGHFSPDARFLLSSSADCTVRLWSTELNANLVCYKGHNYPVWDVQWSPVGHYFASASHDRTARVWCMDRIQPLRIMAGHLADVDCVRWHVNCNYIATGSSDKTVRLWDVQTGECMRIFAGHCATVLTLAMSPDGRHMASGDEDGAIMVWDLGSGRRVTPLLGHTGCVWSLAFSGEGSLLASGSADNSVRIWDVSSTAKAARADDRTGTAATRRLRLVKTLPTKSTPVYGLQFTRRNLLIAAGAFNPPKASPSSPPPNPTR